MRQLVNTVVPRSLHALHQHQENITQLLEDRDWDRVNAEQINAARTAQVVNVCSVYYTVQYSFGRGKLLCIMLQI